MKKHIAAIGILLAILAAGVATSIFFYQMFGAVPARRVEAMFLESRSQVDQVEARLTAGEDFGAIAAELSLDAATRNDGGDLGSCTPGTLEKMVSSKALADAVFKQPAASDGLLSQVEDPGKPKNVGYWLVEVTGRDETTGEARVSGMLLASREQAEEVETRLEAGEDFTAMAEEYSQRWSDTDKDSLGEFGPGSAGVIGDYVLNPDIQLNEASPPIEDTTVTTTGGFWLFIVTG